MRCTTSATTAAARTAKRVPNPLARGATDDGVRVIADHNWIPRIEHGAINYDPETGDYIVIAGDDAELDKLNQRVAKRAAKDKKTATFGPGYRNPSNRT